MVKVAICDNKLILVAQTEALIFDICKIRGIPVEVDVFHDDGMLRKEIRRGTKYDLLYLGCRTETEQGVEAAKQIRAIDNNVLIIYMSACDKQIVKLFRLNIFAFIRKPVEQRLFYEIFLEANQKICENNFYFTFHFKYEEYKLPCKEILYFESMGKKIKVNLQNGEEEIFVGKLSDVEDKLSDGKIPFLRIHQSYLVNYYLIKSRTKTGITLVNGLKLPISTERQKKFAFGYSRLLGC